MKWLVLLLLLVACTPATVERLTDESPGGPPIIEYSVYQKMITVSSDNGEAEFNQIEDRIYTEADLYKDEYGNDLRVAKDSIQKVTTYVLPDNDLERAAVVILADTNDNIVDAKLHDNYISKMPDYLVQVELDFIDTSFYTMGSRCTDSQCGFIQFGFEDYDGNGLQATFDIYIEGIKVAPNNPFVIGCGWSGRTLELRNLVIDGKAQEAISYVLVGSCEEGTAGFVK